MFDKGAWRLKAECKGLDTKLFFYDIYFDDYSLEKVRQAKAICAGCEVVAQCLDFAIKTSQLDGIWGGNTPEERRSIRRSRNSEARRARKLG